MHPAWLTRLVQRYGLGDRTFREYHYETDTFIELSLGEEESAHAQTQITPAENNDDLRIHILRRN